MSEDILGKLQESRIIDNRKLILNDVVQGMLSKASKAKFAVGFMFASGFRTIHGTYEHLQSLQVIMGHRTDISTKEFLEKAHEEVKALTKEELDKVEVGELEGLYNMIRQGRATFKIYLKEGAYFHSKLYLITYPEGIVRNVAIFGSGNFSESGLVNNVELNTYFFEPDIVKKFDEWFDEIWGDAKHFDASLLEAIQEVYEKKTGKRIEEGSEGVYTPFDAFLLTLYKLFEDEIDNGTLFLKEERKLLLTEWQEDAVNGLLNIFEKYPVAVLADTVGLGKTRVGIQVAKTFKDRGEGVLFIAPAVLVSGKDAYWRKEARSFGFGGDFRGLSSEAMGQGRLDIKRFKDIGLIVIDEAHYFRNRDTERYRFLEKIKALNPKSKVLCVTATPVNNSVFDLYNLLYLFLPDDAFKTVGIASVRKVFDDFLKEERSAEAKLREILEEIAVKRTREFVKKHYRNAEVRGTPLKFPERRLHTVHYSLEDVYPGIFDNLMGLLQELEFPQFRLISYSKNPDSAELVSQEVTSLLAKLTLLKRLESSVEAFKKSVANQIDRLEKLRGVAGRAATQKLLQPEVEEDALGYITEKMRANIHEIIRRPRDYDLARFDKDAETEIEKLRKIQSAVILSENDEPKSTELVALVKRMRAEKKKILIFTSFIDTASFLFGKLRKLDIGKVAFLSSQEATIDSATADFEEVINRFAPIANEAPGVTKEDEIDVLVCTDLVSEGLNLQDGSVVVSYDLPWNPMKLLQREGRIDRLRSKNDEVEIENFIPEAGFEQLIAAVARVQAGIRGTLRSKISQVSRTFGKEFQILEEGEAVEIREFVRMIGRIDADDLGAIDELEARVAGASLFDVLRVELRNIFKDSSESQLLKRARALAKEGIVTSAFRDKRGYYYLYELGDDLIPIYYDYSSGKLVDDWETILPIIRSSIGEKPDGSNGPDPDIEKKIETEMKSRRQEVLLGTPAVMRGTYLRTIIARLNQASSDSNLKASDRERASKIVVSLNRRFAGFIERKLRMLFAEIKNEPTQAFLRALEVFVKENNLDQLSSVDSTSKDISVKRVVRMRVEDQQTLINSGAN